MRNSSGSSANTIFETVSPGSYLEIKDNKFKLDSLIVIRRSDFERLLKHSSNAVSSSSRIKRFLISITETTQSYSFTDPSKAEHVIKAISQQANLALELATVAPIYESRESFFSAEVSRSTSDNNDATELPRSKAELKRGIKRKRNTD